MCPSVDALRVSVVSDEPIVRDALVSLVSSDPRFVATSRRLAERGGTSACRSFGSVILFDRPSLTSFHVDELRWLVDENPACRVVLLTGDCSAGQLIDAFAAGASAIMRRAEATELLFDCLSLVQIKSPLLWGELALQLLLSASSPSLTDEGIGDYAMSSVMHNVTRREREIAECLMRCLTTEEIADELHISPKTVRNHISNLYAKTGFRSRVELLVHLRKGPAGSIGGAVLPLRGGRPKDIDDLYIRATSA